MTRREIANLCCRVLAVYAILQGVGRLSYALSLIWPLVQNHVGTNEAVLGALMGTAEPVLWLAAGAFLWRWSGLIAAWMIGTDLHDHRDEPEDRPRWASAEVIHTIAFSTVGLWVLVEALPRALGYAMQVINMGSGRSGVTPGISIYVVATTTELALRLAIGLYLLFGASGLVRLVRGARDAAAQPRYRPMDLERDSASPSANHPEPPP